MITRCDHCGSRFQVSSELINSDDPQVRCGECMSLFDARLNLYDETHTRQAAVQHTPVRRRKAAEVAAEQAALQSAAADQMRANQPELETADTVASEHFYTRGASESRSSGGPIIIDSANGSTDYQPHRVNQNSVADVEFELSLIHI